MNLKNKTLVTVVRVLLGLFLLVFGLNGFLQFMPMPTIEGQAGVLLNALFGTSYMLWMIAGLQVVVGVLLLAGKYVPLAAVLLAPFSVNIVLFHVFLMLDGIVTALIVLVLNVYLAWVHWKAFAPLLKA